MQPLSKFYIPMLLILLAACGSDDGDTANGNAQEGAGRNTLTLTQEELRQHGIAFSEVQTAMLSDRIVVPAAVVFDQDRMGTAASPVEGRIHDVRADYGQRVTKGQVLAAIESMEFGRLVSEALQLQAEAESARKEYARLKLLRTDSIASEKAFQQVEARYRSLQARAEGARYRLAATGLTNGEMNELFSSPDAFPRLLRIRAPITGVVTERHASAGALARTDAPLFVIVNTSRATVRGNVFQEDIHMLNDGLKAAFVTSAYPEKRFSGTVRDIGAALEGNSHTLPVWCTMANSGGLLKPNLKGELHIETGTLSKALSMPGGALIYDGADTYVFLERAGGTLEYVPVEVGEVYGDKVVVKNGLNAGDRVVSEGMFMLKSIFKLSSQEEE